MLSDSGGFSVRNEGTGSGGTIEIDTDRLLLEEQARITATTTFGFGGNVEINVCNSLQLRNGSQVNLEALGGTGDGGNLEINADTIVALENSDIIANAVGANGGNIDIATQAIFGTEFRPQLTPHSDITASSQLGLEETVQINTPDVDAASGLVELETDAIDRTHQIVRGCTNDPNAFVVSGRGGLLENPTVSVQSLRGWSDNRDGRSLPFLPIFSRRGQRRRTLQPSHF